MRAARSAGAIPKTRQVAMAMPAVKSSTRQSVANRQGRGGVGGGERPDEHAAENLGEADAERGAARGQQAALRQELTDQRRARRAERQAHGDFVLARGRARQHQVGEVRARDQEHEAGHREQQLQRHVVLRAEPADAGRPRIRGEAEVLELLRSTLAPYPAGAVASKIPVLSASRCADARSSVQPGRSRPIDRDVEHFTAQRLRAAERLRDVEALADGHAEEPWRRDADDFLRLEIDGDPRVAAELPSAQLALPVRVADHHLPARAARRLVCALEETPAERLHAEDAEELPADRHAPHAAKFGPLSDAPFVARPRERARERLLVGLPAPPRPGGSAARTGRW